MDKQTHRNRERAPFAAEADLIRRSKTGSVRERVHVLLLVTPQTARHLIYKIYVVAKLRREAATVPCGRGSPAASAHVRAPGLRAASHP